MSLLSLRDVSKHYGGVAALDGVSFDVMPGTITAIIGPNGAGKSTCFNLISGHASVTSGTLRFRDEDITRAPAHAVARRGIARTFQTTSLFARMSVLDNVMVARTMRTHSNVLDGLVRSPRETREARETREGAFDALRFTGIAPLATRIAGSLSQEAQKRLAIAIAIVAEPAIVLLDEPVAGITSEETRAHVDLIRSLARQGTTICLVEHTMSVVMDLADTIVVLHHGKKIAEGTPAQVRADPAVIDAYLGAAAVA